MQEVVEGRWENARRRVVARWREILNRIEARDEGGVLGLANVIDEFCEEAIATRFAILHGQAPREIDLLKFPGSAGLVGSRCVFCRGFQQDGGCFGMLASLNSHVMAGRWDDARQVAEKYIARLEAMYLADIPEPQVH
jgi:hypothetical protein